MLTITSLSMFLAREAPPRPRTTSDDLRARIIEHLQAHRGNVLAASRAMGVRRTQLYRWAHRFEIDMASFRRRA